MGALLSVVSSYIPGWLSVVSALGHSSMKGFWKCGVMHFVLLGSSVILLVVGTVELPVLGQRVLGVLKCTHVLCLPDPLLLADSLCSAQSALSSLRHSCYRSPPSAPKTGFLCVDLPVLELTL